MELRIEEALRGDYLFVDLRSEKEYGESHIPFATSVPLLDDHARATVGTLYRQVGKEAAVKKGLEHVGPLLAPLVEKIKELSKEREIVIYCAKGGMRSGSVYTLMHSLGIPGVHRLQGGYKEYRHYVLEQMPHLLKEKTFIVFQGLTGVGKTKLLEALSQEYFVLDLEKLAHHRGSVFGALGEDEQPSQKDFENILFHLLFSSPQLVLVEAESSKIGKLSLPREVKEKMKESPLIFLEASLEDRVELLYEIYAENFQANQDEILEDLWRLKRQLGYKFCKELEEEILEGDVKKAIASLLLHYYDPLYMHSIKRDSRRGRSLHLPSMEEDTLDQIKRSIHDLLHS